MTEATLAPASLSRDAAEALSARFGDPEWLLKRRLEAWRLFEEAPMPDPLSEEWRRTERTMTRTSIEQLLYQLDEAFRDNPWGSLLNNLKNVNEDDWEWLPPDGKRSILHIVQHVGYAKLNYENHAFGDRSMNWERAFMPKSSSPGDVIDWLREGHERLRASVAALADDGELKLNRMAPWGTEANTRWIVNNMIQHDTYHSGEINHIRAQHQRNDE